MDGGTHGEMSEETFEEQLERVEGMASGSPTWDLSRNDLAALSALLEAEKRGTAERDYMREGINAAHEVLDRLGVLSVTEADKGGGVFRVTEYPVCDRIEMLASRLEMPIPMLLFCPNCGEQHVDAPQPEKDWTNPPHRSHECQFCGWVWRPSDALTNGVLTIETAGKADKNARPRYYKTAEDFTRAVSEKR